TGSIKASVQVENVGGRSGDQVVQLYIHDVASSVTRPVRELKGFKRITLNPGEKRRVEFTLTPKELGTLDRNLKFAVEPGEFRVFVGNSSDANLQTRFTVGPITSRPVVTRPATASQTTITAVPAAPVSAEDNLFLEDLEKRSFQFFWEHSDPKTGLTLDRARTSGEAPTQGESHYRVASIASTGFGLT